MAAESPVRTKPNAGNVVLPQHVTDPTILDGVAGFISDYVPAAYTLPTDNKDQIQWARFEQLAHVELNNVSDFDKVLPPPVILILGYTTGIQIWAVPATGEAKEILSWRHGSVKVLTILPNPEKIGLKVVDIYATKRPLIALCDNVAPGNDFCSLSYISLKNSEQVKLIKFKNPILDVVANKRSVVVTFAERIAVFDAFTLEDRATVTTCYLSPGIYQNPIALGTRWLAYAENKLIQSRRSSGGNDGEGVQSYTATVLHAAKSLGRGLRELSDAVASSLSGIQQQKPGLVGQVAPGDVQQKGIVTILDIEKPQCDESSQSVDAVIAHFTAHKEAIVCLKFDPSGLLLLTADKRGHDFHLFRIQPHPAGPALAAVHHLYILHRGDTTARVQDMSFSPDSRWATVSTLRGTTHVFPITSYGGNVGVRTHATPHVVNKMSRFHRSAGLNVEGRSNSPVTTLETPSNSNLPYHNPRLPPYPHPTVVQPLAQIRQPLFIQSTVTQARPPMGRQRSGSSSDDNSHIALRVTACFAAARAWIESPTQTREPVMKPQVKPVDSLFIMSLHGSLIQYDLEPRSAASVPKEKICDDTQIELGVTAKAQWVLQRLPSSKDVQPPLTNGSLSLVCPPDLCRRSKPDHTDDKWLSQVEIVTHAGPHRRLWMGPQFTFKTYSNSASATSLNIMDSQVVEIGRSKPVNMPISAAYPILIEAGSVSSCEPSPKLLDTLQKNFEEFGGSWTGELQLREDLADAMLESPGVRDSGGRCVIVSMKAHCYGGACGPPIGGGCVAKVVNPLGMVVTVHSDDDSEAADAAAQAAHKDEVIHENCDEALFRPVVASKAVVFAEPKNVRSKIATNVLHHKKCAPLTKPVDAKREEPQAPLEAPNNYKRDKVNNNSNKNKTTKLADRVSQKENYESHNVLELAKDVSVIEPPNGKSAATKKPKKDAKKKLVDLPTPNVEEPSNLGDIQSIDAIGKVIEFDAVSFETLDPEVHFDSKEATVELLNDSFFDASEACQDIEVISEETSFAQEFNIEYDLKKPLSTTINVFDSNLVPPPIPNSVLLRLEHDRIEKEKEVISSSEEAANDEKQFTKKPRKPKAKLGVRISNSQTTAKEDRPTESTPEVTPLPRTWSSVASGAKVEVDLSTLLPDLPPLESFTFSLPTMNYSKALQDEKTISEKTTADDANELSELVPDETCEANIRNEGDNLLKADKNNSDENSSSQTETTESDDSSKVPQVIMDTEEDATQQVEVKPKIASNKSKKPKKKRR